jgi:hypothetical protein
VSWHQDEVNLKIDGRTVYLWRAVDAEDEVLDVLVQLKRDQHAALKLMRKLSKKYGFVQHLQRPAPSDLSIGAPRLSSRGAGYLACGCRSRLRRGRAQASLRSSLGNVTMPTQSVLMTRVLIMTKSIPIAMLGLLILGFTSPANAADRIVVRATQYFCRVVAIDCDINDLDSCPRIFDGALGQGQAIVTSSGHLCYKRSKDPSNCATGLSSTWTCFSNTNPHDNDEIR